MKKINWYEVVGLVKKGGHTVWVCYVEASNAKDAKAIALAEWEAKGKDAHLFHLTAKAAEGAPLCELGKWVTVNEAIFG